MILTVSKNESLSNEFSDIFKSVTFAINEWRIVNIFNREFFG